MKASGNPWPTIDDAYTDIDGQVDPAVYQVAVELWGWACSFAASTIRNSDAAYDLMKQAIVLVTQERRKTDARIENLKAYLRQTYKHLIFHELQRENRRTELTERYRIHAKFVSPDVSDELDRRILIEQLYKRMDPWMRQAFELLALGYTAEIVASFLGIKPNLFRSKYSKKLSRLKDQIHTESQKVNELHPDNKAE